MKSDLNIEADVLVALGEFRAELRGLREQAETHQHSVMQRIDDLHTATTARIDTIEHRVSVLEDDNKQHWKNGAFGAVTGALMSGLIEFVKHIK